jgi:hypothetical protein
MKRYIFPFLVIESLHHYYKRLRMIIWRPRRRKKRERNSSSYEDKIDLRKTKRIKEQGTLNEELKKSSTEQSQYGL